MSGERIVFDVPLPPLVIRSNNRSHWARRVKAKQAYSAAVFLVCREARAWPMGRNERGFPWQRARVTFTWRACHEPDQPNVVPNCKALLDILCMAPPEKPGTKHRNATTYLGLIEDDRGVEAIGKVEQVRHRADECVIVEVERVTKVSDG